MLGPDVAPVARVTLWPDESEVRRLELHEARAHGMRPGRSVRELPDGVLVHDELDADPFWNRIESLRLPDPAPAFDERLDELVMLFAGLNRRPHIWASPGYHRPRDLETRLASHGWIDLGRGLLMALSDPAALRAAWERPRDPAIRVDRLAGDLGPRREVLAAEVALVSGDAFAVEPGGRSIIVDDFLGVLAQPGFGAYLVRVDDEPAAIAKATTFDGATYLSTIGTRPAYRGRGLAALATAAACVDALADGSEWIYLGVFEANLTARRLYARLGFEDVGAPAGDWLLA
jgi:ribosomal protein S18 acetylase RimI-like enzyme